MDAAFRQKLLSALALELPYPERGPLSGGRPAAVLLLFAWSRAVPGLAGLSVLVTKRTDSVGSHKGQMAFPGGMSEPEELGSPSGAALTALRETHEEVGIEPGLVEILGALPPLTTITDFEVIPVVGMLRAPLEDVELRLNRAEIAEVIWVPFETLTHPSTYSTEYRRFGDINYPIHVYQVREHRIWGATGSMIKNLLDRLQAAL
jgi:8-oxo-dGTP pyrophosphatase MutT (NUDIX family)